MTRSCMSRWALIALAILGLAFPLGGACAQVVDVRVAAAPGEWLAYRGDYMPLTAGRTLTYETTGGEEFALSFGQSRTVRWFDGTAKEVVPVWDTRCNCHFLFTAVNGQVRAVGALQAGELSRWGEYVVVYPGDWSGEPEAVTTPAGRFDHARKVETSGGAVWFAPGVGIVKTEEYMLIATDATLY